MFNTADKPNEHTFALFYIVLQMDVANIRSRWL